MVVDNLAPLLTFLAGLRFFELAAAVLPVFELFILFLSGNLKTVPGSRKTCPANGTTR
jgi:hypothetical protein